MKANFELTPALRQFLDIATSYPYLTLGSKFPVSIQKRGCVCQRIVIYPEGDFPFFTGQEVECFISLAKALRLSSFVRSVNGIVVLEITDYFKC